MLYCMGQLGDGKRFNKRQWKLFQNWKCLDKKESYNVSMYMNIGKMAGWIPS